MKRCFVVVFFFECFGPQVFSFVIFRRNFEEVWEKGGWFVDNGKEHRLRKIDRLRNAFNCYYTLDVLC